MENKLTRKDKIASGEITMPTNKASGKDASSYRHDVSDDELVILHNAGNSLREIGRKVNMEHHSIKERLIKAGITFETNTKKDTTGFIFDLPRALELHNAGKSCNAIGKELGTESKIVKKHLQKAGVIFEQSNYSRKSLDEHIERIKELYHRGFNYTQIATQYGTSSTTIKTYLQKAGVVE